MKESNGKRIRWMIWILLGALGVGVVIWLFQSGLIDKMRSLEELRALIDASGPWAGVVFFLLQMLTVIIAPIPSNVTMLAGALALGFVKALALGVLAVIAGSVLVFLAARKLGQRSVQRFLDRGKMDRYLPMIREKQEMFLFLTMLFPFFPDDMLCILAGLTQMPLVRFVVIMALTRPWGLAFAALLGGGMIRLPVWGWIALVLGMAAVFCLSLRYSALIEEKLLGLIGRFAKDKREKR